MSNLEIEKAAMGPRRWIELCAAFERRLLNHPARKGPGAILCPRSTRIINELIRQWDDFHVGEDGDHTIASLAKTTILTKGTNQLLYSQFVIADIRLITADLEAELEDIDLKNPVNDDDDLALDVDEFMDEVEDPEALDSDVSLIQSDEDQLPDANEEIEIDDSSDGVVNLILYKFSSHRLTKHFCYR